MKVTESLSLEEIQAFLEASEEVEFKGRNRDEVYLWVNQTLRGHRYQELKRTGRGVVRRYIEKMTGLSRAQITRLITLYLSGEEVKAQPYHRHCFVKRASCKTKTGRAFFVLRRGSSGLKLGFPSQFQT